MPEEYITKQNQNYFREVSKMMMFHSQPGLLIGLLAVLFVLSGPLIPIGKVNAASDKQIMNECRKRYGSGVKSWHRKKSGKIVCVKRGDVANAGSTLTAKQIRAEIIGIGKCVAYQGIADNAKVTYRSNGEVWPCSKALEYAVIRYATGIWKLMGSRFCTKMWSRNLRHVCGFVRRSGKGFIWSGSGAEFRVN